MEQLSFAVGFTLAAVIAAAGLWLERRRVRWLERVTRRRLLVHTRDGQTFDGHLLREDLDGLVLSPALLADEEIPVDGEVWVPRDRVAWVQHPS